MKYRHGLELLGSDALVDFNYNPLAYITSFIIRHGTEIIHSSDSDGDNCLHQLCWLNCKGRWSRVNVVKALAVNECPSLQLTCSQYYSRRSKNCNSFSPSSSSSWWQSPRDSGRFSYWWQLHNLLLLLQTHQSPYWSKRSISYTLFLLEEHKLILNYVWLKTATIKSWIVV